MNHERHDENDDDSRTGHLPQAGGASQGINEDGTAESQEADKGAYGVVDHGGTGRQKESDVAIEQDAFPELSDRELEKLLVAGVESSFSGALPPPDIFMQYPIEVRERMCAWNDAFTINESHRQDKLVDAEISQGKRGQWATIALFTLCILGSLIAFIMTRNPCSFILLSVPVCTMLTNMVLPVFSRSSRGKEKSGSAHEGK